MKTNISILIYIPINIITMYILYIYNMLDMYKAAVAATYR